MKNKVDKILKKLPRNLKLTDGIIDKYTAEGITDAINEYLSEKYGFCSDGYGYDITINLYDISWDLDDIDE